MGAGEEVNFLRNDRSERGLIILQVAADGPFPIDGWSVRDGRVFVPIERAHDGLADFLFEQLLDFLHDGADDHARGVLRAFGNAPFQ